jgi:hypothetical protein
LLNGKSFAKFIADLPEAPNDSISDLIAHFPNLGGSVKSAEQAWRIKARQLATSIGYESLTVGETERRLDSNLYFQFPKSAQPEKFWNLEEFSGFIRLPEHALVLNSLSENLMALGVRANPVCRPIVLEYQQIASTLARGKTHGIERRLAQLKRARETLMNRVQEMDDYMNWFEATQAHGRSGKFAEYLKTTDEAARSRRHDAISVYLDSLESEFGDE